KRGLWLGAARPIDLVIDADGQGVEIGAHTDGRDRIEIIVLAAEIVEIVLDLARDVLNEPKLDAGANRKAGAVVSENLRCRGSTPRVTRRSSLTLIQAPPHLA